MSRKSTLAVAAIMQLALVIFSPRLEPTFASSYDDFGTTGSFSGLDYSQGTCTIFTGPRQLSSGASLADNEFLLTINNNNGTELSLQGTFNTGGPNGLDLTPNPTLAESAFTSVLQAQADDPTINFQLERLTATATLLPVASSVQQADCTVQLAGNVIMGSEAAVPTGLLGDPATDDKFSIFDPVTVNYKGVGTYYPGVAANADTVAPSVGDPQCSLPSNLQPDPQPCSGANCLLDFAGYKWWTYNQFYSPGSGFWNNNNVWSPRNVTVDGAGLHLFVRPDNIGNGTSYMAGEAVLLENPDGSIATLGYGTYLVTAQINSAATWDGLDPNVALGMFTYEREETGTDSNPAREIDLAEISRWGHPAGQASCQDPVPVLCQGNAQFTLQKFTGLPDFQNIRRYTINSSGNQITLVMQWNGANQPVTFNQYNGAFTLGTLPDTPNNTWTSSANQNPFIPANGCQKFILNFWMGNFPQAIQGINPPPSSPQEIVITNFQYQAPQ
jgi:hypothetical protein